MILSIEQRKAAEYPSNALVVACPGSGKTRTLAAKLLNCIDEVRDSSRRICCITYTNTAVHEIEDRLRRNGRNDDDEYVDISTIHSFCVSNILSAFHCCIDEYQSGFKILSPEDEEFKRRAVAVVMENGLQRAMAEYFEGLNRGTDGRPIGAGELPEEVIVQFWSQLQADGLIDFPSILYFTYRILQDKSFIARAVASRYAWFLIDEFQDTTELQVEILRLIAKQSRSKFFLVGDPFQSIFGFAGARMHLLKEFASEINACTSFKLTGNYRSSSNIIGHAEKLYSRNPPMIAIGENAKYGFDPLHYNCDSAFDAITDYFLPEMETHHIELGQGAILARTWYKLLPLGRKLREFGVPITGPGARPYRKSRLIAPLAEVLCAYARTADVDLISQCIRELFFLLTSMTGKRYYSVFSYEGKLAVRRIANVIKTSGVLESAATKWLVELARIVESVLMKQEYISQSQGGLLENSAIEMIEDMKKSKIDIANLTVNDLGLYASHRENLHLLTMHKAKGREFDAVAIIDLHEGKVPDYRSKTVEQLQEDQRLLYVCITRARKLLMYITDREDWRNRPSRFLQHQYLGVV